MAERIQITRKFYLHTFILHSAVCACRPHWRGAENPVRRRAFAPILSTPGDVRRRQHPHTHTHTLLCIRLHTLDARTLLRCSFVLLVHKNSIYPPPPTIHISRMRHSATFHASDRVHHQIPGCTHTHTGIRAFYLPPTSVNDAVHLYVKHQLICSNKSKSLEYYTPRRKRTSTQHEHIRGDMCGAETYIKVCLYVFVVRSRYRI